MENGTTSEGRDPSGFLSEIIGAPVTVKLNSGVVYKGRAAWKLMFGTARADIVLQENCSLLMDT